MKYHIVADSSCDLSQEVLTDSTTLVPLTIYLEDSAYVDDSSLSVDQLLDHMRQSPSAPRSACPSPHDYMEAYANEGAVFVITLSNQLSGSYNSAMTAKKQFLEAHPDKFIHVFDSKSASSGETLIYLKLAELIADQKAPDLIVSEVEAFITKMQTMFVLENLDVLIKNGRMSKISGFIAGKLSIKPILKSDEHGSIAVLERVRGLKKALERLVVHVVQHAGDPLHTKVLTIAHCHCKERAEAIKLQIEQSAVFQRVIVVSMKGLSSTYANEGGIVLAF